jgi:hypothetical protein
MTDYQPLIARAVEALEKNTGEARRGLYERARNALVTQLRSVDPPLSESDITKERLALEDAIRKVEADAARRARIEARPAATPPAPPMTSRPERPAADGGTRPAAGASARERLLGARTPAPGREGIAREGGRTPSLSQEGIRGFRDVVGDVHDLGNATSRAVQSARETRDTYVPAARHAPTTQHGLSAQHVPAPAHYPPAAHHVPPPLDEPPAELDHGIDYHDGDVYEEARRGGARAGEPTYDRYGDIDDHYEPPHRHAIPSALPEEERTRPPRSYRGLGRMLLALVILGGLLATVAWQWPHIAGGYRSVTQLRSKPNTTAAQDQSSTKFAGRVPQEQGAGTAGGDAGKAPGAALPAVAQRVVLYEEDPKDPQGKRFVGSAIWHTETVSPGPGLAPELAVRADIEIPERHMTVTWSLRRNTDQALPASHTIEIMFNLPADSPGGGIANVPGILMKQSEQARGTPLAGLAVKVTNGFFLIGLSAVDADVQRNTELLKERPWFDIPVVYTGGGRAILAMEKGPPGDRAFADAFAIWEKK